MLLWLLPAHAWADALPSPGRPDWEDTPLPMPDEVGLVVAAAALVLGAIAWWAARRRPA